MTPEAQLALIAAIPSIVAAVFSGVAMFYGVRTRTALIQTQVQVAETKDQVAATTTKLDAVGHQIDGKMEEIKTFTRELGNAAGRVEGTAIERDRVAVETAAANAAVVASIEGKITVQPQAESPPSMPPVAIPGGPDPKPLNGEEFV